MVDQTEIAMNEQLTELQELEMLYCEMYKDVYGVKARWYRADSVEQARKDLDLLQECLREETKREEAAQAKAIEEFEATVQHAIEFGAGDRETALRWLIDDAPGEACGDREYFCFLNGLPYGYFNR